MLMSKRLIACFFSLLLLSPLRIEAAQVLQVRSSSLIQIGDNNRSYTIRLSCVNVDSSNESAAKSWLKSELPRGRKVNLHPEGVQDGILVASVTPLGSDIDLREGLSSQRLSSNNCV